jgi:hypothetical protein
MIGTEVVTVNGSYVNSSEEGFSIKGVDNDGYCMMGNANVSSNLYYNNDPIVTFDDSILYGCKVSLTEAEL